MWTDPLSPSGQLINKGNKFGDRFGLVTDGGWKCPISFRSIAPRLDHGPQAHWCVQLIY